MSRTDRARAKSPARPGPGEAVEFESIYDKLVALARNLWWTAPEVVNLFRDLDRFAGGNWIIIRLRYFRSSRPKAGLRAAEMVLYSRINHAYRRLKEYLADHQTWAATHAGVSAQSRWPISRPSSAFTNRCRSTPAAWAYCRGTMSKAPATWACRSWRSACITTRAISSSISTQRLSGRRVPRHQGRKPAYEPALASTASRSRFRSTPAPANCWPRCG